MNNEKLLKIVREVKETKDFSKLAKLENIIIEDIKLSKVSETTTKTRYKEALRVFKKIKGKYPILGKAVIKNGFQLFTDSYVLFKLIDIIPELPEHTEEKEIAAYPNMESILNNAKNNNTSIKYSCKELKQMIKINEKVKFVINEDFKIIVDNKLLLSVIRILDYSNDDIVEIFYDNKNNYKPLYFNNNDNESILMPLKC